jgi:hypothetical protein
MQTLKNQPGLFSQLISNAIAVTILFLIISSFFIQPGLIQKPVFQNMETLEQSYGSRFTSLLKDLR